MTTFNRAAPILGTTADGSASAESARGLLLTVLGELALPSERSAWTRTLIAALGGLGVKEKAARQALARMERPGWLERNRQGRSVRWVLGDDLHTQLERGGARIYSFGLQPRRWDGTWLLLVPTGPFGDRSSEFRFARSLRWAGFGPASKAMWICPWIDRQADAVQIVEAFGLPADVFEGRLAAMGTDEELVARAWTVAELGQQYEEFLNQFGRPSPNGVASAPDPGDPFEAAVTLIRLVHQWRRFPLIDPDLPDQLLPVNWAGRRAAQLFAERRAALLPAASAWWAEQEGTE